MAEQAPDYQEPGSGDEDASAVAAPLEYPLEVVYCEICTMPPEVTILCVCCKILLDLSNRLICGLDELKRQPNPNLEIDSVCDSCHNVDIL